MYRVLLVDEDCLRHTALAEYLEGHGFLIVCVETPEDALEQICAWRPSVILLPRIQGDVLANLQKKTTLPIVAATPSDPADLVAALLRALPHSESETGFQTFRPR
jgi:CheY-like chemotaxis protein